MEPTPMPAPPTPAPPTPAPPMPASSMPVAPPPPETHRSPNAIAGRAVLMVAMLALVASSAFFLGEVRGERHEKARLGAAQTSSLGTGSLSGLSISQLEKLQSQVQQAASLAQSATGSGDLSGDLSQLEQQLGISPSSSIASDATQLQAELNAINSCLSSSSSNPPPGC